MGRQKKVVCEKCFRIMRSDVLKRHMKQHEKKAGKYENEPFVKKIGSSMTSMNKDFETVSEFSSVSASYNDYLINKEVVIKNLVMDDKDYKYKIEMGKLIYETVKERNIVEGSICKEYKELMELFMKQA